MNKIVIGIVILLILAGAGFYLYKSNKGKSAMYQAPSAMTNQGNVFSSIQDALMKRLSLTCDYTDNKNVHTVAYVKNGMVRADITGTTAQQSGHVIIKDNIVYYWNNSMALKMTMPSVSITPGAQNSQQTTGGNIMSGLEAYKKYCKETTVADSLFVLPSGVTFKDMSQIVPSYAVPTTSGTSGGYTIPTQYQQQYMQYQSQSQSQGSQSQSQGQ